MKEQWDVIPGSDDLMNLTQELEMDPKRVYSIGAALQPLTPSYDFILLDCPASTGAMTCRPTGR